MKFLEWDKFFNRYAIEGFMKAGFIRKPDMCRKLASPLVSLGTRVSISSSEHVHVQDYCGKGGVYEFCLPPLQSMNTRFPSKVSVLNFWGPSFACGVFDGSILQYARTIKHLGHGLSTRRWESTGEDHRDYSGPGGKTGVTVNGEKMEFSVFYSSSTFNKFLSEESLFNRGKTAIYGSLF